MPEYLTFESGGHSGEMRITTGDFNDPRITDLIHHHQTTARAQTQAGSAHSLDVTGLQSADIDFWAIWDDQALLAIGALRQLSAHLGEIKSMHTTMAARRRGVASIMLRHIIAAAREKGLSRLSLETGSWDYFKPAMALYAAHGFAECPPFGDYQPDPNSAFMTLEIFPI